MTEKLSQERPVDEPLPTVTWRKPMFRDRCWNCGDRPIPEGEIFCDHCLEDYYYRLTFGRPQR